MKKFGFGKKGDDGDDPNRSALFGRKKSSPAPSSDNPYAKQGGSKDPYADDNKYAHMTPYQQARAAVDSPGSQPHQNPYGAPPPAGGPGGNNGPAPARYGADKFGTGGGYGSNRYDNSAGQDRYNSPAPSARGPGGYGGFGPEENDSNRAALLSGAQERHAHKQQQQQPTAGGYGQQQSGADTGSYGGYGEERQLTAEEQEEAEYQAILAEKRKIQGESAASTSRSLQMAREANERGRATLARLGGQGERLNNTERHLDVAHNQNKNAQAKAKELARINGSLISVKNPFTSSSREMKREQGWRDDHQAERAAQADTRKFGYDSRQRMETEFRGLDRAGNRAGSGAKKDYGKFNMDDEEGADELEEEIDNNLTELQNQVSMMNMVGRAIGKEVDVQNERIDRISEKASRVDEATVLNRERLARIR